MAKHRELLSGPGPVLIDSKSAGFKLDGAAHWSITQRRLTDGVSAGIDVVDLKHGEFSVSVVPTRGMGIWRASLGEVPVEWQSPVRNLVHPALINLTGRNGLGWLEGFNELVCRCGLAFNGPPGTDEDARGPVESQITLHGRIGNRPAEDVELEVDNDGPGVLSVTGIVDESAMFGPHLRLKSTISTMAGSNAFTIRDEVLNLGSAPAELELLYHINLGRPFLEQGSSVACPARTIVPRDPRAAEGMDSLTTYQGPTPGYAEQVYYYEPLADSQGQSLALLKNAHGHLGVSVEFNIRELPRFSLWKCTQADADGYVTGLEPGTNYPNFKAYERKLNRVIQLAPAATHSSSVTLTVHATAQSVAEAEARIQAIQGTTAPVIYRTCQPGWSAAGDG